MYVTLILNIPLQTGHGVLPAATQVALYKSPGLLLLYMLDNSRMFVPSEQPSQYKEWVLPQRCNPETILLLLPHPVRLGAHRTDV